jgi:hypothetical protein
MRASPKRHRAANLAVAFALISAGCVRIISFEESTANSRELESHSTFVFLSVSSPSATDAPLDLLRKEAIEGLLRKGFEESDSGRLVVELRVGEETVRLRTATSDPGYNSYTLRSREEAVATLRITDTARTAEIWRGVSKVRLPREDLLVGPSREEAWLRALTEIIDRLPESPPH